MPTAQQLYMSLPGTSFNLVPNPNLRPESSRTWEAGLRGRFERGWFSLGVFHSTYKDFIASLQNIAGTTVYTSLNLSSVVL
jgi:hemoglobin/transferrin/lactoferrin receptor protein